MGRSESLQARALGERLGTACAAIAEMIRKAEFVLSEEQLDTLEAKGELLAGWVFAYRVRRADPSTRMALLRGAVGSANPRVREQVCDLIGDLRILELRSELFALTADAHPAVAEAASHNYAMLAA
jgi:hypothetical protein